MREVFSTLCLKRAMLDAMIRGLFDRSFLNAGIITEACLLNVRVTLSRVNKKNLKYTK